MMTFCSASPTLLFSAGESLYIVVSCPLFKPHCCALLREDFFFYVVTSYFLPHPHCCALLKVVLFFMYGNVFPTWPAPLLISLWLVISFSLVIRHHGENWWFLPLFSICWSNLSFPSCAVTALGILFWYLLIKGNSICFTACVAGIVLILMANKRSVMLAGTDTIDVCHSSSFGIIWRPLMIAVFSVNAVSWLC